MRYAGQTIALAFSLLLDATACQRSDETSSQKDAGSDGNQDSVGANHVEKEETNSEARSDSDIDSDTDLDVDSDSDADADMGTDMESHTILDTSPGNLSSDSSHEASSEVSDSVESSSGTDTNLEMNTITDGDVETHTQTEDNENSDSDTSSGESTEPESDSVDSSGIRVDGRELLVKGMSFFIKGVCWNPVPKGGSHPTNLDYSGFASTDIPLMQEAGFNAVRTYEPLLDTDVLDQLHNAGIYVMNSVYPWGGSPASDVIEKVNAVKDHPAVLMWVLGNEWNYNGLYTNPKMSLEASLARLNEVAALIRLEDNAHPIATVYGELPDSAVIEAMPDIDIWGLNVYSGLSFYERFSSWRERSTKPFFFAEYGADAYNSISSSYDPDSQAEATRSLTQEIVDNAAAYIENGTCLGGTIFEWADEWWKAPEGDVSVQETEGDAPGGGPYPDQTFNEEWWGIVDIDRQPRAAFYELKTLFEAL